MRVIQERDTNNTPLVSYTRGLDLSGSLEGAGGIGGLLARSSGYSSGSWTSHAYYHADGNGNITTLIDSSQSVVANYRYDPFGNTLLQSGTLADANVYRFSSKEVHTNSAMYYYGYRFYDPVFQRWINRDPIQEWGGMNLYAFVGNQPLRLVDPYGLDACGDLESWEFKLKSIQDKLREAFKFLSGSASEEEKAIVRKQTQILIRQELNAERNIADLKKICPKPCTKSPWWKNIPPIWRWPLVIPWWWGPGGFDVPVEA
jgi:RHS repeat-associated protein